MKRLLLMLILGMNLMFAGSTAAPDLPPWNPGAPNSNAPNSSAPTEVIVQFKAPPTKDDLKALGPYGQVKKMLVSINAVHIALTPQAIHSLAGNPNVRYISPNRKSKGALDITTQAVSANLAWSLGWTGTGVGVAVIDSGVALKHDLTASNGVTSRVVYSQSFVSGQDASDGYGHGTHVAGIIGSSGIDSTGPAFSRTFKGVAPNVNLISLKVLDQNGSGQESDVIAAIEAAINLKSTYNIRVINLSLGRQVFESYTLDPLCQAVEAAWKAGIVVVTAAGNYGRDNSNNTRGYGTIASPGNDPYVITVGATNTHGTASLADDTIASYSSRGPTAVDHLVKPDLVAPGNGIVSLLASPTCTLHGISSRLQVQDTYYETGGVTGTSSNYLRLSGTSMATPVVSGAAALLIQQNPSLTPDQVKARLMKTAAKILPAHSIGIDAITLASFNNQADVFTVGAGYLNINAALSNSDLVTLPALSPVAIYNSSTKTITIVRNFGIVWGDDVVWGDSVVWGPATFSGKAAGGNSILWGADMGVVWGDSTTTGFDVVWGDTVNVSSQPSALSDGDDDQ